MGNILLICDNKDIISRYRSIFSRHYFNDRCTLTAIEDFIDTDSPDVVIVDESVNIDNLFSLLKTIRSKDDNAEILLIPEGETTSDDIARFVNGYLPELFSDELILSYVNACIRTKEKLDRLNIRNADLSESLYRLNVLYNTSSQFSGTLDTKELLRYMIEGLDKSLSFDLTCTMSFGFEDEPVLIIDSLYDLSEELVSALKLRSVLNYKSLFDNNNDIPFELDDKNLKIIKNIKNPNQKFDFSIFQYDNMFAPIDIGSQFFGCIEIFKEKQFSADDSAYFQTVVRQVSQPLKSAGLYKEIKEKNLELEKLERIKSDFISIVSHELRTPLTPIKNALSILFSGRCGQLGENAMKFVDMAKRNADNLTNIINDILDINKIEAGKMDFNYSMMNIHSVIENVRMNFDVVAKENNINFKTVEQDNLPQVYADNRRLEQVLRNLVSNAIKFTPAGKSVTISSELKNADDIKPRKCFERETENLHGEYIIVSVTDEGIGIKEENLTKAFEQFTQIENALTRKVGGTGLGLPIARQLVKAHKGAIWCDSIEDSGSSFHFAIPVCSKNAECTSVEKELI